MSTLWICSDASTSRLAETSRRSKQLFAGLLQLFLGFVDVKQAMLLVPKMFRYMSLVIWGTDQSVDHQLSDYIRDKVSLVSAALRNSTAAEEIATIFFL